MTARIVSQNGYQFTTSINKAGTEITLVAHKDDHEGRKTEVFHLSAEEAGKLWQHLKGECSSAKARRKACRRADTIENHTPETGAP